MHFSVSPEPLVEPSLTPSSAPSSRTHLPYLDNNGSYIPIKLIIDLPLDSIPPTPLLLTL